MAFQIEAFQNRYLAPGQTRVDAILSVTADAPAGPSARPLVVGFVIDKSGSMQGARLAAVKTAVSRAIHVLDPSAVFFVVAFDAMAQIVVESGPATPANKQAADAALAAVRAHGGTALSAGLAAARERMERAPDAIRQCIFLTDGKNESERPGDVEAELRRCAGQFQCDAWGVGTEWRIGEVQAIAAALMGKASIIPDPAGIEAAFRDATAKASAKAFKDARLRLWTPIAAQIVLAKQVNPTIEDLAARAYEVSPQIHEYVTGSWSGGEARDFHIAVEVRPGAAGDEMLAARPSMVYLAPDAGAARGWVEVEDKPASGRVFASWTDDDAASSRIDRHIAHYLGQDELAQAIVDGLDRRERGDQPGATRQLGRAVRLANAYGNAELTLRLARVVDVVDAAAGTVRLKAAVQKEAAMDLALESRTTKRARAPSGEGSGSCGSGR